MVILILVVYKVQRHRGTEAQRLKTYPLRSLLIRLLNILSISLLRS
jgi:hypothetical protein